MCQQAVRTSAFPVSCSRVGRWWYDGEEIDVVGVNRETNTLLLGECKWTTTPVGRGLFDELTALESSVRWQGDEREVNYVYFSRAGFTDSLQATVDGRSDSYLFGLDELTTMFELDR